MPLSPSSCDELVANAHGKWQIRPATAVKMAQLTATDAKLDAPESVRRNGDIRPGRYLANDLLLNTLGHGVIQYDAQLNEVDSHSRGETRAGTARSRPLEA